MKILIIILVAILFHTGCEKKQVGVTLRTFGTTSYGQNIDSYTLVGAGGVEMEVLTLGGAVRTLSVPGKDGKLADVTLGFNTVAEYEADKAYFGALLGRYSNRIAGGTFKIDGKTIQVAVNEAPGGEPCSLHGGTQGFDKKVWQAKPLREDDTVGVILTTRSPDGDQGYPGNLDVTVTYRLTPENIWRITYEAQTDKPTPVNLSSHVFFNLKGEGEGTILDHDLTIESDTMTLVGKGLVPDGTTQPISGTIFDFTTPHQIGARIEIEDDQIAFGGGYDLNYILRNQTGELAKAATVTEKTSGRRLEVWTTEPAIQFYSGNFLTDTIPGKYGRNLKHRGALALEPQHTPNSVNLSEYPNTILQPGEKYNSVTEFRFSLD